jgi:hypothetical protein
VGVTLCLLTDLGKSLGKSRIGRGRRSRRSERRRRWTRGRYGRLEGRIGRLVVEKGRFKLGD